MPAMRSADRHLDDALPEGHERDENAKPGPQSAAAHANTGTNRGADANQNGDIDQHEQRDGTDDRPAWRVKTPANRRFRSLATLLTQTAGRLVSNLNPFVRPEIWTVAMGRE